MGNTNISSFTIQYLIVPYVTVIFVGSLYLKILEPWNTLIILFFYYVFFFVFF